MNQTLYSQIEASCPFGCVKHIEEMAIRKERNIDTMEQGKTAVTFRYSVSCSCGAQGPHGSTVEEAIQRWNEQRNINEPDRCFDYCDDCPNLRTADASSGKPERCQDFCYICPHQPTCSDRDDTTPWEGNA